MNQNYDNLPGHLTVNSGPMFSGKTVLLTENLNRYADLGFPTLYINSDMDNRSDEGISTHNSGGSNLSDKVKKIETDDLWSLGNLITEYKVIGVDEAQFFGDNLSGPILEWVNKENKIVHVVGLDLNAKMQRWGQIADLAAQADVSYKLTAKCTDCLNSGQGIVNAPFTSKLDTKGPIIDIGGSDKYISVCRKHWNFRNRSKY